MVDGVAEEHAREKGSVLFADPCTSTFTKAINKPIDPVSHGASKRTPRIESMTGNLVPWECRSGLRAQDSWAAMNAKRGITSEEND